MAKFSQLADDFGPKLARLDLKDILFAKSKKFHKCDLAKKPKLSVAISLLRLHSNYSNLFRREAFHFYFGNDRGEQCRRNYISSLVLK